MPACEGAETYKAAAAVVRRATGMAQLTRNSVRFHNENIENLIPVPAQPPTPKPPR